jgi:hypothetical protein
MKSDSGKGTFDPALSRRAFVRGDARALSGLRLLSASVVINSETSNGGGGVGVIAFASDGTPKSPTRFCRAPIATARVPQRRGAPGSRAKKL